MRSIPTSGILKSFYLWLEQNYPWKRKASLQTPNHMAHLQSIQNNVRGWPPQVDMQFPDIDFTDHEGKSFSISMLRGKPTIVEIVAMSCAGCQAFSEGNRNG